MKVFYVVKYIMGIFKQKLYINSEILFAKEFIRIVSSKRGSFVEFSENQIIPNLHEQFNFLPDDILIQMGHYYRWLYPEGYQYCKVYKQLRTVGYADYKTGLYYVDVHSFVNFIYPNEQKKLFL